MKVSNYWASLILAVTMLFHYSDFIPFPMEATAYAPLDPAAVEGMCYSGDPTITASGRRVVPGLTVAAGPEIPFDTELYIHGIGRRVVHDRGGRITTNKIDILVESREEALRFGRRTVYVSFIPSHE